MADWTPDFFKILLKPSEPHLPLPHVFVSKYLKNKIPNNPTLESSTGGYSWKVRIEKIGERYCFTHGWNSVVRDAHLDFGYFLVFKLVHQSTFRVSIFSPSGCEEYLPPSKIKMEDDDDSDVHVHGGGGGDDDDDVYEGSSHEEEEEEEEEERDDDDDEDEDDDDDDDDDEEEDDDGGEEEEEEDDDGGEEEEEEEEEEEDDDDDDGGGEEEDDGDDPFFTMTISKTHKYFLVRFMKSFMVHFMLRLVASSGGSRIFV